jgi:hypothetical protein
VASFELDREWIREMLDPISNRQVRSDEHFLTGRHPLVRRPTDGVGLSVAR